jgi:hypothetical protein
MEAVVERTGLERFAISAQVTATLAAIAFAARHPDQVMRLVVIDGFARWGDLLNIPQIQALVAAAKVDWTLATEVIGFMSFGAGRDENKSHGEYIRACIGPDYFENSDVAATIDVTEFAGQVKAPTLVMKHVGMQYPTMEMTKDLAARIPNAQLAVIEGTWADNIEATCRKVAAFVNDGKTDVRSAPELPTGMTAILFADIADSTALTERLGDTRFREMARDLDAAMRLLIREHSGTPIEGKLLGDGVLAVFTSARQAIEAALCLRERRRRRRPAAAPGPPRRRCHPGGQQRLRRRGEHRCTDQQPVRARQAAGLGHCALAGAHVRRRLIR